VTRSRVADLALGALGIALCLGAWQAIGVSGLAGLTWPPLTDVLAYLVDGSHRGLLGRALAATLASVAWGYGVGMALGLGLAALAQLAPATRPGADRLAALVHAIPAIALAPLFIVLLSREATPAAVAALGVFFVSYVATTAAFEDVTSGHRDLLTVLGAGRWRRFSLLAVPAAVPAVVTGAKLAVPAALIGAILGEWFGAPRGLGVLMVSAMQNFQIPLLWAVVLLAAAISLVLFRLGAVLERAARGRFR
jgi:ABC-type nitrate/sulfonate/bicarbonate transport system permease component